MCPACGDPLLILEMNGVEADYCGGCHGAWLEAGDLEALAVAAGPGGDALAAALAAAPDGAASARRCLRCHRRLREVAVAARPATVVDRCAAGHGLWFDRGEIVHLIAVFGAKAGASAPGFLAELYRSEFACEPKGD